MFVFSRRSKYLREHTFALPFLHINHKPSLPAGQGLTPYSHHTRNKCTLIIPYLMPLEVFYQTQIIILSCMYFGCFHGNQHCVAACHYFYTWGVLHELDVIGMMRPYGKNSYFYLLSLPSIILLLALISTRYDTYILHSNDKTI